MDKNIDVIDLDLEELKKKLDIGISDERFFRKIVGENFGDFIKDEFLILKFETYLTYSIYLTLEVFRGDLRFRMDSYNEKTETNIKTIIEPFGKESYLDMLTSFDGELLRLKRREYQEKLKLN